VATPSETVPPELAGALDRAVRVLFGTSWGRARGWIEAGKVRVDGAIVRESTARVRAGARIAFDERARRTRPGDLTDEQVVYVDQHVVVVVKPAGVSTVPYDETDADTLDARVRGWLAGRRGARGGRPSLGIVHRLDKQTSGLVVFTRTWLAKSVLALQFRKHTVHRRYLAVAQGEVPTRTIRSFLLANRGDGLRGSARGTPPADAREAVTHFERIEALRGATLVGCRLETGRTHQIRIHLGEWGHPVLGESVYVRGFVGTLLAAPRLMLHAAELGFVHPATEREMRWEAEMPEDMRELVRGLKGRGP